MDGIFNWFGKCTIYFIPVLLMWVRYHSFLLQYKKTAVDVIVDGQFCVIPFCLNLETIFRLWSRWSSEGNMRWQGGVLFVCVLVIAFAFLLLYWDISFIRVQKEDERKNAQEEDENLAATKKKKILMFEIILFLAVTLGVSFYVDVIL